MSAPITYRWDGEHMDPLPRFRKECDARYVIGGVYTLDDIQHRSSETHRHYFACISDAWTNLPDSVAQRWSTPEALRKYCLIQCGFRDERSIVCASKAEAQRVAAFIRPMDEYAVVTVSEAVVRVWTAQSQSMRAMGKQRFAESKEKVLALLEDLLGVEPGQLGKEGARAA